MVPPGETPRESLMTLMVIWARLISLRRSEINGMGGVSFWKAGGSGLGSFPLFEMKQLEGHGLCG